MEVKPLTVTLAILLSSCQSPIADPPTPTATATATNVPQYLPISIENADQITLLDTITITPFSIDMTWISDDEYAVSHSNRVDIYQIGSTEEPLSTIPFSGSTVIDSFDHMLAVADYDHIITLLDIDSGEEINRFSGHTDSISQLQFSSDGQLLVSASFDHTVKIWDIEKQELIRTLDGDQDAFWVILQSSDNTLLISTRGDDLIYLWDINTSDQVGQMYGLGAVQIALNPAGDSLLLRHGITGEVFMCPIEAVLEGEILDPPALFQQGGGSNIIFSHDGSLIILGDLDNGSNLFDSETGEKVEVLSGHSALVSRVGLNPSGTLLASYAGRQPDAILIWGIEK